jgi:DNA-binding protein HU-beta
MNRAEMIDHIVKSADVPKSHAERVLDAYIGVVRSILRRRGTVRLVGLGTFYTGTRAARNGRHPLTGVTLRLPAKIEAKFRPSKSLADAVNI